MGTRRGGWQRNSLGRLRVLGGRQEGDETTDFATMRRQVHCEAKIQAIAYILGAGLDQDRLLKNGL